MAQPTYIKIELSKIITPPVLNKNETSQSTPTLISKDINFAVNSKQVPFNFKLTIIKSKILSRLNIVPFYCK